MENVTRLSLTQIYGIHDQSFINKGLWEKGPGSLVRVTSLSLTKILETWGQVVNNKDHTFPQIRYVSVWSDAYGFLVLQVASLCVSYVSVCVCEEGKGQLWFQYNRVPIYLQNITSQSLTMMKHMKQSHLPVLRWSMLG